MKELIIKTQAQLDKVKLDFDGYIYIEGGTREDPLELRINFEKANVICRGSAFINMRGNSQVGELRENSQVGVLWENSQVGELWGNSQVGELRENSQVGVLWENSQVGVLWGNSQVGELRENSQVGVLWENSQVGVLWGNSRVGELRGNSQVGVLWGNSRVTLYGEACVSAYSAKSIVCNGYNVVRILGDKKDVGLKMNKTSHLIIIPKFKPTFEDYKKRFPTNIKGNKLIAYKTVHKVGGEYISNYNCCFKYKIGEIITEKCDPQTKDSCSYGIHVSDKSWAISFGKGWSDMALLEVETDIKNVVVAEDCDGKIRTSKIKVLREVPKEEYDY